MSKQILTSFGCDVISFFYYPSSESIFVMYHREPTQEERRGDSSLSFLQEVPFLWTPIIWAARERKKQPAYCHQPFSKKLIVVLAERLSSC